jgi:CHAT domain-containing protein
MAWSHEIKETGKVLLRGRPYPILQSTVLFPMISHEILRSKNLEKFIIIPSNELLGVPFHSLQIELNNSEKAAVGALVQTYYSLSLKSLLRNPWIETVINKNNDRILSCVNANKGDTDLPYTFLEGNIIRTEFRNSKVLYGQKCTFNAFLQLQKNYDIIHLALHGSGNHTNPKKSGVHFRDQFVNYYDLQNNLKAFDVAFLNICSSQVGPIRRGEGIQSILRAFLLTHTKLVISSYDLVDDYVGYKYIQDLLSNSNKTVQLSSGSNPHFSCFLGS